MLHHVFDETEGKEEILLLNTWAFTYVRHVDFFPMHCQFAYVKDLRIWKCFMLHSILNIPYILFSKDLYVKSSLNKMSPQGLNGIFVIKIWIQIQVYVVSMRTNSLQISLWCHNPPPSYWQNNKSKQIAIWNKNIKSLYQLWLE